MSLKSASLVVAFGFSLVPASAGAEPLKRDTLHQRLFPMNVGHEWVYAYGDIDVTFRVLRAEAVGGARIFVVRRTIGKTEVDFRVEVAEDGVYIHQDGKKEFLPPLRQFAFFARTGDGWKWRGTASGRLQKEEFENLGIHEVVVPAGTYSTVAVHQSNPDNGDQATFWLAAGVGVVKLSGKTESLNDDRQGGKVVYEWRLRSFKPGKQ